MSRNKRRSAATATVGLAGVGGAGMLRHQALEQAYLEKTPHPVKRPRVAAELRMLKHPKGRARWLAGAGLGVLAVPPAAVGTHGLLSKRDSLLREGYRGVRDSISQRNETIRERPPVKLQAANYLTGVGIGSAAGGLTHRSLRNTKLGGAKRSGLASIAAVLAGTATLPVQSKIISHASHGKYEATATGVRRKKQKPVPASAKAGVNGTKVAKMVVRVHGASIREGYHAPRGRLGRAANEIGARAGAKWTTGLGSVADTVEHYPAKHRKLRTHVPAKLVKTGRNKAGETVRAVSYDVSSINDKDKLIREVATGQGRLSKGYNPKQLRGYRGMWTAPRKGPDKGGRLALVRKADDPGGAMTRGQRRTRFVASGGVPLVGDFTSAAQAARLAPPGRRRKVAAQQGAANVGSGLAGNIAGGVGAAYLAGKHKGFERHANAANDWIDAKVDRVRASAGMKPAHKGPGRVATAMQHPRLPTPIRSAAGLVASKPKVAAIGALVGGAVTGTVGSQAHYGRVMTRDDRYRKANPSATHGSRRVSKLEGKPLSQREKKQLASRKRRNAGMLYFTGTTGLGALGATTGEKILRTRKPTLARHLGRATVPLLTAGAGVGGLNAYTGAKIQRREAQAISKGLRVRRVRGMRGGYLRQTRLSNGATLVSSVRGGLG